MSRRTSSIRLLRYPGRVLWALLLAAAPALLSAQDLVISELDARNRGPLLDEDGDTSDWIELHNPGGAAADTAGWALSDDPLLARRWLLPARTIVPGGFLVVFASGKDRPPSSGELHTDFELDAEGEYLALIRPDGSIASEFTPAFPPQRTGVSYGLTQEVDVLYLVPPDAGVRYFVPEAGAPPPGWEGGDPAYDDSSWRSGTFPMGYALGASGFAVRLVRARVVIGNLDIAEEVLADPALQAAVFTENAPVIDYLGTNGGGRFPLDRPFPGSFPGEDVDNFAVEARGTLRLPQAGAWTFGVRSDDGFGLDIAGHGRAFRIEHPSPRGPADTYGVFDAPEPGDYEVRLVFYERGGGSELEFFAARGAFSGWNGAFRLAGDTEGGGLEVRSELVSGSGLTSELRTDLSKIMPGQATSLYARMSFPLPAGEPLPSLALRARYDDGFIAYLNGVEVARRNAPASPAHDTPAPADRPLIEALRWEEIDLTAAIPLLRSGENVFALHVFNDGADSPDFLIAAELARRIVTSLVPAYFPEPTPGQPNGEGYPGFVADTKFSPDRGFYTEPIAVEISSATPGAEIYYTMDGSEPSPENGALYTGPVPIARTTVLRARAFREGLLPTDTDTHTYIFPADVVRQDDASVIARGFPPSWGGTSPDYAMDPRVIGEAGTDLFGGKYRATIEEDLLSLPTLSIAARVEDLFGPGGIYTNSTQRGPAWERPCSAELIYPDGREGFQVNCGLRIQGGAFRSHGLTKKHSLRLLFKAIYGPTKLRHPWLGEGARGSYDTITLRANSNDGWQWAAAGSKPIYVRDSFGRETVLAMGGVASHETFVHLYINGVYWGLYNPVERPDAAFAASYFGGRKEEWDAISNGSAADGDMTAWNTLLALSRQGLASDAAYMAVQGRNPDGTPNPALENYLDAGNLIDYMIANLYAGNTDWPHKNYWIARRRVDSTGFKFFMWDSEWSLGLQSDLATNRVGVSNGVAAPYAAARENREFRMRFADHVHRHFFNGGALYVDPAAPEWDPAHPERNVPAARFAALCAGIERAITAESARWGDQHASLPYTRDEHWAVERDRLLREYFPRRSAVVLEQFRAAGLYPQVGAPRFNRHGGDIAPGFELSMTAPAGTIYYTLDGTDPRLPGGALHPQAIAYGTVAHEVLVAPGAAVRYLVPENGALGLSWTDPGFDDSGWNEGTLALGYERSSGYEDLISTDIEALLYNRGTSVYARVPFESAANGGDRVMTLKVRFDDGFAAYLNGVPLASGNAPPDPAWDSQALSSRPDGEAVLFATFTVEVPADLLRPGRNVLALHGLNRGQGSSDFLLDAVLEASAPLDAPPIVLERTTLVRARALSGGEWSALNEALFVVPGSFPLRITEIMYHPPPMPDPAYFDADEFEYIELQNVGLEPLSLENVELAGGVRFSFSQGAVRELPPGGLVLAVENAEAFALRYPEAAGFVAGEYEGRLANDGEPLVLRGPLGEVVLDFAYDDAWFPQTDGGGFSLVAADPRAPVETWGRIEGWRPSLALLGTPGVSEDGGVLGGWQLPGDANQDGTVDVSDAVRILRYLFGGAASGDLPCGADPESEGQRIVLDLNGDGGFDIADAVHLLGYLFRAGPPPAGGRTCRPVTGCPTACAP